MVYGRTGPRPLDDPAYDDLFATAARWRQPIFIHPQIPSNQLRDAAYRGLDPLVDLGLATFGWGWHMDAGLPALRLILRGTFDRHPDLQLVLGHWGEMLLFWMDRADSLSGVVKHLERRVPDYIKANIHITSSGMLQERLLRHPRLHQRRPGAVLHRLSLPPARCDGGRAVLRRHPPPRGAHQDRLRQRRDPIPPGLTATAPRSGPDASAFPQVTRSALNRSKIVRVFEFMPLTSAPDRIRTCAHGSGGRSCSRPLPAQTHPGRARWGAYGGSAFG
jgi:Amidohydrolase